MTFNAEYKALRDHNEKTHLVIAADAGTFDQVCVLCNAKNLTPGANEIRDDACTVGAQVHPSHFIAVNDDVDTPFRGICVHCNGDKLSVLKRECKAVLPPKTIDRNFGIGAEFTEADFADEPRHPELITGVYATGSDLPGRYVGSEDGSIVRYVGVDPGGPDETAATLVRHTPRAPICATEVCEPKIVEEAVTLNSRRPGWADKVIETPLPDGLTFEPATVPYVYGRVTPLPDTKFNPIRPDRVSAAIDTKMQELMILTIDGHTHELDIATAEEIADNMKKAIDEHLASRFGVSGTMEAYFENTEALEAMREHTQQLHQMETPYGSVHGPINAIEYLAVLVEQDLTPKPLPPSRTLEQQFEDLLNGHENESNTPDFVLARYMMGALRAFNEALTMREKWYGRIDQGPGSAGGPGPINLKPRPEMRN